MGIGDWAAAFSAVCAAIIVILTAIMMFVKWADRQQDRFRNLELRCESINERINALERESSEMRREK